MFQYELTAAFTTVPLSALTAFYLALHLFEIFFSMGKEDRFICNEMWLSHKWCGTNVQESAAVFGMVIVGKEVDKIQVFSMD